MLTNETMFILKAVKTNKVNVTILAMLYVFIMLYIAL